MDIITDRKETIFRRDYEGKKFYSIGMSKKRQDGSYENGYASVQFNKDVELENKTQIMIKKGWLDFYNTEKEGKKTTHLFIRVSEFEVVAYIKDKEEQPKEEKKQDGWGSAKDIEIDPDELPFY